MKVINNNGLPTAPISSFAATQGDLKFLSKDNYDKLKGNIERRGFDLPVSVWIDDAGQKWLLDGHQRKHVLETEGWLTPIPYLEVKAKDLSEASERLLEITSQYGTITQEGLDEYIAKFELPEFDVLNRTNFDGIFEFSIEEPEEDEPELEIEDEVKNASFKLNLVHNGEEWVVKSVNGKKTNKVGAFESLDEAKNAAIMELEEYEDN